MKNIANDNMRNSIDRYEKDTIKAIKHYYSHIEGKTFIGVDYQDKATGQVTFIELKEDMYSDAKYNPHKRYGTPLRIVKYRYENGVKVFINN